jgi:hypothetical protein
MRPAIDLLIGSPQPKFSNHLGPSDTDPDPVLLSGYIGTLTKLNFITYEELGRLIVYLTHWATDGVELACATNLFTIYNSFENFRKDHGLLLEILSTLKENRTHVSFYGRGVQEVCLLNCHRLCDGRYHSYDYLFLQEIYFGLIYQALLLLETAIQS